MKKALLIIDVQNDYFKHGKMELHLPEEALMKINKLEDYFIEKKQPIIYVQHIKEQGSTDFFERGTKGVLLHEKLKINSSSIIIEKQFPNSFFKTNLKEVLETLDIQQVIITGMMTHMCIDSTTRASKEYGYDPILISDATATKSLTFKNHEINAENVQLSFLSALTNFSNVVTTNKYLK
ncbi:cysteine hydrolase family protein [Vagococcus fluvialis]|uniref:cysteine hydrolase family protein n=1 Tax=Vagococcus fluvialis TaxID=2738 RepID=UPI003B226EDF